MAPARQTGQTTPSPRDSEGDGHARLRAAHPPRGNAVWRFPTSAGSGMLGSSERALKRPATPYAG
eukprot:92055-Alexandrium_andersonii.AAC.1